MNRVIEKNKKDWELYSPEYVRLRQSETELEPIVKAPHTAFEKAAWEQIKKYFPQINGRKICVPSSGDNHAVFAFALLGAEVFSSDFCENTLNASKKAAEKLGIGDKIKFICTDTMQLSDISGDEFDLVYTSNGVYVWLDDLNAMFRSVHRILRTCLHKPSARLCDNLLSLPALKILEIRQYSCGFLPCHRQNLAANPHTSLVKTGSKFSLAYARYS